MDVQLATIEALALAIEAKAGCTPEHVRSIQHYAATLAEAAGMSDADVQTVRTAALLHDVGNLAVPEHILSKPSALTAEEFERVKIHPACWSRDPAQRSVRRSSQRSRAVPSRTLGRTRVPARSPRCRIPLGARILAIADCFSALQSDRPYRPQRNEAEALAVIWEHSGARTIRRSSSCSPAICMSAFLSTEQPRRQAANWLWKDIAGAHREAQTLYEIRAGARLESRPSRRRWRSFSRK
jgi:hypothetical protein